MGLYKFFWEFYKVGVQVLSIDENDDWMGKTSKELLGKETAVSEDSLMRIDRNGVSRPLKGKGSRGPYKKHRHRGRPRLAKNLPLNPKQEAYCRYRVEKRMNKANAYRMAYGDASATKDTYVYAYLLERKPHIIERMRQLLEDRAAVAKFYGGPEEALASWHNIMQLAHEAKDIKSVIRAQENIDKITGADKANLMNDEVAKTMFLSMHGAENKDEFQEQITKVLMQLQNSEHKVKPKGVKFGEEGSFRGKLVTVGDKEASSDFVEAELEPSKED
jgi:hypothetical protein